MKSLQIFSVSLLLCLAACNKQLDLAPEDTLTEKQALETQPNAFGLLGEAYMRLYEASRGEAITIAELSTGIITNTIAESIWYSGNYSPISNELTGTPILFWQLNYAAINSANVIINKLPVQGKFDQALIAEYVAESKFIRAMCYFNLIKLYGDGALEGSMEKDGVPLRLQSFDGYDGSQIIPRSSNGKVFAQILKDIEEAVAVLPERREDDLNTRTRAVKGSANALGARVALYMHNDQLALEYCGKVLSNSNYMDAASILDVFADNSRNTLNLLTPLNIDIPELIFAFPPSYNKSGLNGAINVTNQLSYIYGVELVKPEFLASYEPNDIRANEMFVTASYFGMPPVQITRKFADPNQTDHLVVFRRAEFVLSKAEALARTIGVNQQSVDLINSIHQRSFAPANRPPLFVMGDFPSREDLIEAILRERQWELALEGHHRFDLIRTGQAVNPILPKFKYALPIPNKDVVISRGVIKQNQGY